MLGPTADAEDVAQEAFVAAYKALSRFQSDSKFSTWLYRIAVNKCTDSLRARRPDVSLDATGDESAIAWNDETPHWAFEQAELGWELDKGIQALQAAPSQLIPGNVKSSGIPSTRMVRHF